MSKSSPRPLVNRMLNHPHGAYSWQKLYSPEICEHIPALYEGGKTNCEVAALIGICESTFYDWVKQYPAFASAVKYGKTLSKSFMTDEGRKGALGLQKMEPKLWHLLMRNEFGYDADFKKDDGTANLIMEKVNDLVKEYENKNARDS